MGGRAQAWGVDLRGEPGGRASGHTQGPFAPTLPLPLPSA